MPTFDSPPFPGSSSPTVTISDNLAGTANAATSTVAYSLVFSDVVAGLEANDFVVTNGTINSVTGSGTTWVVNVIPAQGIGSGTIAVTLKAGAVVDAAGSFNAIAVNSNQALDTVAPTASSFSPADEALSAAVDSNIVVTFSEAIQSGIGNILLKTTASTTVATYTAGSSNLTIAGNVLTINPTANLSFLSGYKVEFAAFSISDLAGNYYVGTTSYNFSTGNSGNAAPSGSVRIAGTETQGEILTVSHTIADADGLGTISYQWKAAGNAIAGATANSLRLTEAQVGKAITVTASYSDGRGTAESMTSSATLAVINLNDLPTGAVSFTGTPAVGHMLSAVNTLADPDGLGPIAYQWRANGSAIAGATSATFTPTDAQFGKIVTVTASYTDGHGTAESITSPSLSFVTRFPSVDQTGTPGNDTLTGGSGNDSLNGQAGTDTAVYASKLAAYTLTPGANNTSIAGPEGTDTLTGVERLQFADANLALDLDGNAGQTYRLYQAAFNRTPDLAGLGGWIAAMDAGTTPTQVATSFMASAEFQSLYGANPSNEQFVSLLYTNALHRTADSGGLVYWINQLTSNLQTRAQALVNLSESAENKAAVLPAIASGIVYATATQAAGPAKGQSFTGTSGNDNLVGTVSNDTLTAGTGNDTINGGRGLDTAIYSGKRATYSTATTSGNVTISGGTDAMDTLTNVERLRFDDAILAFDTSGNAGQTYRLYQAAFNRTPDKTGLTGWVNGVDAGMSMLAVAAAFIKSTEFQTLYGISTTDSVFVNLLYTNALHRTADAGGLEYWVNQLSSHAQSREQALLGFSESPENQAALIGVIQNGIELAV